MLINKIKNNINESKIKERESEGDILEQTLLIDNDSIEDDDIKY